ncbi:hypothetical protein ACXJY6_00055 [Vibrio sp. RC27]
MKKGNYKLYAGEEVSYYSSMETAKEAAKIFIAKQVYLRIEILVELPVGAVDWWAYEYNNKQWVPS